METNRWLIAGGVLTAIASLAHLGCIVGGPEWYRFFGAGEQMARESAAGLLRPALITVFIAAVLGTWAAYALAAGTGTATWPAMRFVLAGATAVFLLRGLAGFPLMAIGLGRTATFWGWSSVVCLAIGALYLVGTWKAWPMLGAVRATS